MVNALDFMFYISKVDVQKHKNMKSSTTAQISASPTEEQFSALNEAYKYFNQTLFNNQLPGCILNFSRKKNTHGFLAPSRWRRVGNTDHYIHEISLTPFTLYREPLLVFSTLVHEMVHLWQWEFASPSRNGYHNKEWSLKMEEVGLIPSDTGKKGGKKTGQSMTHYIEEGGQYERLFNKMPKQFLLPFTSLEGDLMKSLIEKKNGEGGKKSDELKKRDRLITSGRKKTKYTCPSCKSNVWGKPKLKIVCGSCEVDFNPC
jgi:predicted SprT family Zn-dependent metalloprotease